MGKFNNNRKNAQTSSDRKLFFDTISDMRKLISKNTNSYTAETLGLGKKVKMPYNHLIGRRKAIKDKYRHEKSRAH
jgi:peroxiredoxin